MSEPTGPAFYASPPFARARAREWWTVLHPPYTALHLSLVVVGACLAAPVNATYLLASVLAFFLAVGVGAHALDELAGRPLATTIPSRQLAAAAVLGLGGAVALGVVGCVIDTAWLAPMVVVGVALVVSYNLELFGGRLHTPAVMAVGWGGFPVLTAYLAEHRAISVGAVLAAAFGTLVTTIQQRLSTPARDLRRRVTAVSGVMVRAGVEEPITKSALLAPLELSLRTLCWSGVAIAAALAAARFIR